MCSFNHQKYSGMYYGQVAVQDTEKIQSTCMQEKKQQLELDMEQPTGSN